MAMRSSLMLVFGSALLAVSGGCPQALRIPVDFTLGGGAGTFEVVAGQSTQNRGTGNLGGSNFTIGGGTMKIKSANVSFTPAPTKGLANLQATTTVTVTAMVAGEADVATVCENPVDEYGPYTITFDQDFNVVSISPNSITLQQTTVDILNAGAFSFCLIVDSQTLSGTLTIDALSFDLGI